MPCRHWLRTAPKVGYLWVLQTSAVEFWAGQKTSQFSWRYPVTSRGDPYRSVADLIAGLLWICLVQNGFYNWHPVRCVVRGGHRTTFVWGRGRSVLRLFKLSLEYISNQLVRPWSKGRSYRTRKARRKHRPMPIVPVPWGDVKRLIVRRVIVPQQGSQRLKVSGLRQLDRFIFELARC